MCRRGRASSRTRFPERNKRRRGTKREPCPPRSKSPIADSIPRRVAPSSGIARSKLFAIYFIRAKCLNENTGWCSVLIDHAPESRTGFRTYLILSAVAFLFVGLYVGWVFYSRSQANQAIAEKAAEKRRTLDQQTFEMMGGNRFDILGSS